MMMPLSQKLWSGGLFVAVGKCSRGRSCVGLESNMFFTLRGGGYLLRSEVPGPRALPKPNGRISTIELILVTPGPSK